jgi:hypothetical protein
MVEELVELFDLAELELCLAFGAAALTLKGQFVATSIF